MAKCKNCPRKRICRDECYGDNPCDFAKAFDSLRKKLDLKTVSVESLRSQHDEAMKRVPERRIIGEYVLTPIQNAFDGRTSWWISKKGFTAARYCFTASSEKEVEYQIKNGLSGYMSLLDETLQGTDASCHIGEEATWEETKYGNWRMCSHCKSEIQQAEDYGRSGLYQFCPRCGKKMMRGENGG